MRRVLLAAAVAASFVVGFAPAASAYCDPDYWPLCTNSCRTQPPDPEDPWEYFTRICPA